MTFYWAETTSTEKTPHPSKLWAEWKSDDKKFKVWKKELKEQWLPKEQQYVDFEMPKEFIVVAEGWAINGYINSLNCWVRSNEIFSFNKPFVVRKNSWEVWLSWTWDEIGEKVKNAGGKLVRNIHIATPDSLDLQTLQMWPAGSGAWREWIKEHTIDPRNYKIKFKGAEEWKKGRIVWSFPTFENWEALSEWDRTLQKAFATELANYDAERSASVDESIAEIKKADDTLPF